LDRWSFRVYGCEIGDSLRGLTVGQRVELALLFHPVERRGAGSLRRIDGAERAARKIAWNRYAVTGEVTFCGTQESVLDIGIPAVCENMFWEPVLGATMSGEIELASLTAGMWGEDLFVEPAPPIDLVWQVERMWLETTPWVRESKHVRRRADVAPTFVEVAAEDYTVHDEGRADYLLDCRILSGPTRF
jgi:hypothetical protein